MSNVVDLDIERMRAEHAKLLTVASAAIALLSYEWGTKHDGVVVPPRPAQGPWHDLIDALEAATGVLPTGGVEPK